MTPEGRWWCLLVLTAMLAAVLATTTVAGQGNEGGGTATSSPTTKENSAPLSTTKETLNPLPTTSVVTTPSPTTISSHNQSVVTAVVSTDAGIKEGQGTTLSGITTDIGEAGGGANNANATNTTTTTTPGATTATPATSATLVNVTTTTPGTMTPKVPQTTKAPATGTNQTTASTCGLNAQVVDGACVCKTNWTHDPAHPGPHCPCPDLCAGHTVTCPLGSECYHLTCNFVTCSCPQHYKFDSLTNSCKSLCQYYGDVVCSLGSGMVCVDTAGAPKGYTCRCSPGYILVNDTCQDVNECTRNEGSPCRQNEHCINIPGSYKCPCIHGYLRDSAGSCININECLNPSLHDCDHICVDASPPVFYTCSCYPGFTWNETQRRCVPGNASRECECDQPERSVCYDPPEGKRMCYPRPGFVFKNGTFSDVSECEDQKEVLAWCWDMGVCVEGVGASTCVCQDGYANDSLDYGRCVGIECPAGSVLVGSRCEDPCSALICPPPLTCTLSSAGKPECQCHSECQDLLQVGATSSVYRGSLVVTTTTTPAVTAWRLLTALEMYFGLHNVEIVSMKDQTLKKRSVSQPKELEAAFLVSADQSNIAQEIADLLKIMCETSVANSPNMCVLPGGLVVKKASITVSDKDPCVANPCVDESSVCQLQRNVSGRFTCFCKPGFFKVNAHTSPGFCQDIDECSNNKSICDENNECINTPGSFVCRLKSVSMRQARAEREMAISFGVLFFIAFFITVSLVYLLMKKNKSTRELVPMSTTSGFENDAYHK